MMLRGKMLQPGMSILSVVLLMSTLLAEMTSLTFNFADAIFTPRFKVRNITFWLFSVQISTGIR